MELTEKQKNLIVRAGVDVIVFIGLVLVFGFVTVAAFPESAEPVVEMFKTFLTILASTVASFIRT